MKSPYVYLSGFADNSLAVIRWLLSTFLLYYSRSLDGHCLSQSQSAIFPSLHHHPCFVATLSYFLPLRDCKINFWLWLCLLNHEMTRSLHLWMKFHYLVLVNFQGTIFILDSAFFRCLSINFFCFVFFHAMNRAYAKQVMAITSIIPFPGSTSCLQERNSRMCSPEPPHRHSEKNIITLMAIIFTSCFALIVFSW